MRTRLQVMARPCVKFNATDAEHRKYFANFLITRCWTFCPVQFYLEPGYGDVVSMIEHKLTVHYLGRELKERLPLREESWVGR